MTAEIAIRDESFDVDLDPDLTEVAETAETSETMASELGKDRFGCETVTRNTSETAVLNAAQVATPDLTIPAQPAIRRDILPEALKSKEAAKIAARRAAGKAGYTSAFQAVRAPGFMLNVLLYTLLGAVKVTARQLAWWQSFETHALRSQAVVSGDSREWMRLQKEAKGSRKFRGYALLGEAASLVILGVILATVTPWWGIALAVLVTVCLLARAGWPAGKPVMQHATLTPRFRRLNLDVVLRAYYAAGLGHPEKSDLKITFPLPAVRDGEGSRVVVDLPYGKGLKDAVAKRDEISSGLDVQISQVFFHRDPTSNRRHTLWVADRDPLAVPVGHTSLLAGRITDIWQPAPIGLDERGAPVDVPILWNSVLVGALPRQGKTFAARLMALYAALDPYCKLSVFDGKGSPDWRKFARVADYYAFGLTPTRQGLPPEMLLDCLSKLKDDVQNRYERLSALEAERPDLCPEGKLTRELARDPKFNMPVHVLILDEVQEFYELGDISKQIAALLVFLVKVAPGAGVSVIASTQKPSGIGGSGPVSQQFTSFRDQMQVRFSLRTSSWQVSEMVLGQGAYSEGLDSSTLLSEYKGVGILRGASNASPTVRTFLADGQDADKILAAARIIRQNAGTLSGMALGEADTAPVVSILADVREVIGQAAGMHWETVAPMLAARFPQRHGDATPESVSARCRAAGVPSVQVKFLGSNKQGCRRADVETAMSRG